MPSKTTELARFYVHSPECTMEEAYKNYIASFKHNWENDQNVLADWLAAHPQYGWEGFRPVDDAFWKHHFMACDSYFSRFRPITPFAVVTTNCVLKQTYQPYLAVLHEDESIPAIEKALDCVEPLRWWGEHYLFGTHLWTLTRHDETVAKADLKFLFLEAIDSERRRFDRLRAKFSGVAAQRTVARRDSILERVKIFVWRRDEGKCVHCGSKERLEFDHIIPVEKGGSSTERNIQLLCEVCNRKKSNHII